jgi:outer membrane protein insertion porin family
VRNLLLSTVLITLQTIAYTADYKVEKIILGGNNHISDDSVIYYLGLNLGSEYTKQELDDMVKKAYDTGFFKKISISHSQFKNILIVDIVEQPVISSIKFYGNHIIDSKTLQKVIKFKAGMTFSESKMKKSTEAILQVFQDKGLFNVIINPKIIENNGGGIDILFEIKEGKKAVIEKINFIGNGEFTEKELKQQILSNEWIFYRVITGGYFYDPKRLNIDCELLNEFYHSNGYPFAKVIDTNAELDNRNDAFKITFIIETGAKLKTGQNFDINQIRIAIRQINDILAKKGFAFTFIEHNLKENANMVDVEIKINQSQKFFVNKIDIKNNTRTRERIIRREMRISEKDSYDYSKIKRSLQRIKNLGCFENVNFIPKQVDHTDKVDIEIDVMEKRTTNAMFNIGYNTVVGPLFGLKYSELNLLGTGRNLNANLQFAKLEKAFDFAINEPYFLGYDMTAGVNAFYDKRIYKNGQYGNKHKYYVESRGIGTHATYNLTEYLKHDLNYKLKMEEVDYAIDSSFISAYLRPEATMSTVSSIGQILIYDQTDNAFMPTTGYVLSFGQSFAGLGGDAKYMQNLVMATNYTPIYKNKVILKISGKGGIITGLGKKVRPLDNFYSQDTMVRGFEYNGIGPRDATTFDALGGKTFITGSVELKLPLGLPQEIGISGLAFADIASLYNIDIPNDINVAQNPYYNSKTFRSSYGLGVIWDAPIGVIRFEYGLPIKKENYDQLQKFNFSIGRTF